jgi:hypothetical protein
LNLLKSKSPAGELFDLSAAAIKPLEACALLIGGLVDEIRRMTVMPLTAEGREIATAAFRMLRKFDSVRADLEFSLNELRRDRRKVEGLSNGR